ncbi:MULTISPECIES: Sec-independent protein translocase TatB [unclassified Curtobacterium]|uniref:Sec-independent protein translocase TatB n=1 Tax=unclassified Curtobacterium TaxID=257496 RepID=UPI000F4BC9DA|nr:MULTISPECIES: Sec-independent protein translocase TatB [unclassified Curtobacterium]
MHERHLPHYAQTLAEFVKAARAFAQDAKSQLREEMGPDFDDVEWRSLDPRQYDPRRIVRDALAAPAEALVPTVVETVQVTAPRVRATAPVVPLATGEVAPFDAEGT